MTLLASQMTNKIKQKKLVFGLGQTGYSCVSYLVKQGYEVVAFDTREQPPCLEKVYCDFPQVDVFLGEFNSELMLNVSQIIASPGISLQSPELNTAKNNGIEIIGDVQLFADQAKAPIVAITGSNGKSTTTSLVAEMFEKAGRNVKVGGNIGIPVLDLLEQEIPDVYVLELSSFQLETTQNLRSRIAVVLNISPDHMDRYNSLDHYAQSKMHIYDQADIKLINVDDAWIAAHFNFEDSHTSFSLGTPLENSYGLKKYDDQEWICHGDEKLIPCSDIKLQGRHQLYNAMVALAVGDNFGLSSKDMYQVLREFGGLAHRTQYVAEIDQVVYINDSKGTNVGATVAAISGMEKPVVLIAGGEGKGADFSELRDIVKNKVRQVILIGRDAGLIENTLKDLVPVIRAVNLPAAVTQAKEIAQSGECVLFSPACASFDMFDNYQHRGDVFVKAVGEMK